MTKFIRALPIWGYVLLLESGFGPLIILVLLVIGSWLLASCTLLACALCSKYYWASDAVSSSGYQSVSNSEAPNMGYYDPDPMIRMEHGNMNNDFYGSVFDED